MPRLDAYRLLFKFAKERLRKAPSALSLDELDAPFIGAFLTDLEMKRGVGVTSKAKSPSGQHVFDLACVSLGIEHRLCPPRHPQTNGMVERFNGRISDIVNQTRFASAAELDHTLAHYLSTYNHLIPQRALKHQSPIQALQKWRNEKPELFNKRVQKQPGLDTRRTPDWLWPAGATSAFLWTTRLRSAA